MKKKNREPKSLGLAFYFALLLALIIIVSVIFKIVDVVKNSKFDGKHSFSTALIEDGKTDIVFVSPTQGTISRLSLKPQISIDRLKSLGIPTDGYLESQNPIDSSVKSTFFQAILHKRSVATNLTIFDLFRLAIYSQRVSQDNIVLTDSNLSDPTLDNDISTMFVDPTIEQEKESIAVTNAAGVPGLGNKIAKNITDIGGNVILVNSSPNTQNISGIYYKEESYTVDRISKMLGVKKEKKEDSSISDITIIIGEDKEKF